MTGTGEKEPGTAADTAKEPTSVPEVHTRLLRLALGVEESRAYWEHVDPAIPGA